MTYAKTLQEAKDGCKECLTVNDCVKEECRWYWIIKALEKQIPKKPIARNHDELRGVILFHCPTCDDDFNCNEYEETYCAECGQAIDWSDIE